ncbi:hypothetical protein TJA_23420 [Thermus sp. LT1-2-5]
MRQVGHGLWGLILGLALLLAACGGQGDTGPAGSDGESSGGGGGSGDGWGEGTGGALSTPGSQVQVSLQGGTSSLYRPLLPDDFWHGFVPIFVGANQFGPYISSNGRYVLLVTPDQVGSPDKVVLLDRGP